MLPAVFAYAPAVCRTALHAPLPGNLRALAPSRAKVARAWNQSIPLRSAAGKTFPIITDSPDIQKLSFSEKLDGSEWNLYKSIDPYDKRLLVSRVISLNRHASTVELFKKKDWNIEGFNLPHLPTVVDALKEAPLFSQRPGKRYFLFMDMPIKMPGKGWRLPAELAQFREMVCKAAQFERLINAHYDNHYVYLTVDQRPVLPGQSQRRTGWHADSFINKETRMEAGDPAKTQPIPTDSIYLSYDSIPTEFCVGPFPFKNLDPNDTMKVLQHFETQAAGKPVITFPPLHLLRLTPECVHRVGFNTSSQTIQRTFAKITFSLQILNRVGNAHNPFFDYNWPMIPRRDDVRNHANVVAGYGRPDADQFSPVSHIDLFRVFNFKGAPWVRSPVQYAVKTGRVTAYPATPGEFMQTALDDFTTTVNTARDGDWKITTQSGDQYFLSPEKFAAFYAHDEGENFRPSDQRQFPILEITKPIQHLAPWGTLQFLRPGDYLIRRGEQDIYGIMRQDFLQNYKLASSPV